MTVLKAILVAGMLYLSSAAFAMSAQLELADPVLPINDGTSAHGNASYGVVLGGKLYDSAGNLGVTMPVGRIGKGRIYFMGDIFTWVKNPSLSDFVPKRIQYTLEPGYDYVSQNNEFRLFIKHQSFHDPDTWNMLHQSYELYGIDYRKLGHQQQYELRAGYYVNESCVDYKWDFLASATFDLSKACGHGVYAEVWLHEVTNGGGRSDFLDYAGEIGMTIHDGFKVFGRYEYLHDLDVYGGASDHHFLIGPKYVW